MTTTRRRTKKPQLHKTVLDAAKQIRRDRIGFERNASKVLSDALGFEVVIKIKRNPSQDTLIPSPQMRQFARKDPKVVGEWFNTFDSTFDIDEEVSDL